jgi:lipopolysaccharide export LptBFGC system permease protein LptF
MFFTLHRYIFRELSRVFVLAVIALGLMLTLGGILQPIQEYGVGPRQVVHIMGYFLPITLTFVLPMAALFATALVYGRFSGDNEVDACRASGISLLTLIYPGLALAVMVAIANLLLSFHVMPYFVHLAEKSLKADAKQILFRNIQRRGYYKLPPDENYLIYADYANPQTDTLLGVVVVESTDKGIEKIITAESAKVHFNPHEGFDQVQITAYKTNQMGADDEVWFYIEWLGLATESGPLLGDEIKFKKIDEMKRIKVNLMRFDPVAKLARQVCARFATELLAEDIANKITNDMDDFYLLLGSPNFVEFNTAQCSVEDQRQVQLSEGVIVREYNANSGVLVHTLCAPKALIHIEGDEIAPTLTMDIYNARVDASEYTKMRHIIRGLIPPKSVTENFKSGDLLQDIRPEAIASALQNGPSPKLEDMQDSLYKKIRKTFVEIQAELHSRLVFGIGCIPMILIGIGLGIVKRGGHLLSAFAASCIPAAVLIVGIIGGKHIAENLGSQSISGIALMWSGFAVLCLMAAVIYYRLLKH